MNIIKNLIKKFKKDKKNIAVLGIFIPDPQNPKNKKLKPIITGVDEAGPSHDVLKENDLILKINEKKINTLKEYENAQKKLKPNEIIIVRVKRRNQELNRAIRTISLEDFEKPKQIHYVRFGFYFTTPIMMRKKDWNKQPTKVLAVAKKSYARNKIKHGDIITAINNVPITNIEEYYIEIKKVLWGESVLFSILRNNKKISFKIKSKSFYDYKLHSVQFGIETKIFKKKYNKVIETQSLFSEGDLIKKGDLILDLTSTVSGKLFKKKNY